MTKRMEDVAREFYNKFCIKNKANEYRFGTQAHWHPELVLEWIEKKLIEPLEKEVEEMKLVSFSERLRQEKITLESKLKIAVEMVKRLYCHSGIAGEISYDWADECRKIIGLDKGD